MAKNLENLIGMRFNKLVVVERAENSKQGKRMWICKCDCGRTKQKPVSTYELKSGKVKSCGCLYYESNKDGRTTTHGKSRSRIYKIWNSMKARCFNPNHQAYKQYSGRGIKVCDEWANNFPAFYSWAMANGYTESLTIDRIDNNKGYSPDNCRWTTYVIQENNRSNNRLVTIKNKTKTLSQWARDYGISSACLAWRLDNNWNDEELNIKPDFANKKRKRSNIYVNG